MPKQYRLLAGRAVLARAVEACAALGGPIVVAIHADDRAAYDAAIGDLLDAVRALLREPATGGATRQQSARAGLARLAETGAPKIALVHDGARPFLTTALARRVADAAGAHGAAIPAVTLTDTVKQIDGEGRIVATPDRASLRAVQTPQGFRFDLLRAAHEKAAAAGRDDFTDDAAVVEWAGAPVFVVEGDRDNMKITQAEDFARAEARIVAPLTDIRVGQGYDVHAFAEGDHVWLAGLRIPHERALAGHSDADVGLHALTDAILGALGDGDIGQHFPPSDPQWRGASSDRFLIDAVRRVARRGGAIAHLDLTIVCEAPKIGPHREAMRARVAAICGIAVDRVGVKATTSERLGFTGRREGIAALAVATLRLPEAAP